MFTGGTVKMILETKFQGNCINKPSYHGCSQNFSKIMKPEIQECEDWECSKVWRCDTSKDEEPDLVWSKERKETGLLGSGKSSKSLVDCEK